MRSSLLEEENYFIIKLNCYICEKRGHLAINCPFFGKRKGNLIKIYHKFRKNFLEDKKSNKDIPSLSISYVYEEDDPQIVPNRRLGDLHQDK